MSPVSKRVAIVQPNYIPWKGYFDLIASCDIFILYDDVQYTKNDWRNRNLIKTPMGRRWLTIPVGGKISRLIKDVEIIDTAWRESHWKSLLMNYSRAEFSREIFSLLEPLYFASQCKNLVSVNKIFLETICGYLGIETEIILSSTLPARAAGSEGVLTLCKEVDATIYISGPSAKSYLRVSDFELAGVDIEWFDYSNYEEYRQLWGPFEHQVTILDLLFNCGPLAHKKMKMKGKVLRT